MATTDYQERLKKLNSDIKKLDCDIDDKIRGLQALQKKMRSLKMIRAAVMDARGGIYDKWYRSHYGDDMAYAHVWHRETRQMIKEGYTGDWNVING